MPPTLARPAVRPSLARLLGARLPATLRRASVFLLVIGLVRASRATELPLGRVAGIVAVSVLLFGAGLLLEACGGGAATLRSTHQ